MGGHWSAIPTIVFDEDVGPEFLSLFVLLFEARNGCDSGDIGIDIRVD